MMESTIDSTTGPPPMDSQPIPDSDEIIIESRGPRRRRWTIIVQALLCAIVLFVVLIVLVPRKSKSRKNGSITTVGDDDRVADDEGVINLPPPQDLNAIKHGGTGWRKIGQDITGDKDEGTVVGHKVAISSDGETIATTMETESYLTSYVTLWMYAGQWKQQGKNLNGTDVVLGKTGRRVFIGRKQGSDGKVQVYDWSDENQDWEENGNEFGGYDGFGLAVSPDGDYLAIASRYENSETGQVKVYKFATDTWTELDTIQGTSEGEYFGRTVSLSNEGKRIAVSSLLANVGSVKIFEFDEKKQTYKQLGDMIKGNEEDDEFGHSLMISSDAKTVAIGAYRSNTVGGAVVYRWTEPSKDVEEGWDQLGFELFGNAAMDAFGSTVAINGNGHRVVVGGQDNDIGGTNAGYVRTFDWISMWVPYSGGGAIVGDNQGDKLGESVAITADGDRLVVGMPGHRCLTVGVCGKVRVYEADEDY